MFLTFYFLELDNNEAPRDISPSFLPIASVTISPVPQGPQNFVLLGSEHFYGPQCPWPIGYPYFNIENCLPSWQPQVFLYKEITSGGLSKPRDQW